MNRYPPISIERLREIFEADMETGHLFWKVAGKGRRMKAGSEAGFPKTYKTGKTYWTVKVNGLAYRRAQIIYAMKNGAWPETIVDHESGDSLDDRPGNLRLASFLENAWNKKDCKKKSDTPMGVRRLNYGRFEARITCRGVLQTIGIYDTADEAGSAYQAKRRELFGEFC